MSSRDTDQKTSFVSFLALVLGLCGFTTSLISTFVAWLFPKTKAKMPPTHKRSSRKKRRRHLIRTRHSICAPTLRRHSSFHPKPISIIDPKIRPNHTRHISFHLDASKLLRTSSTLPRKAYATRSPPLLNQLMDSPESSYRSSMDSATLPSASSFKNSDTTSEYHSSPSMNTVELDIRPALPSSSSLLEKCLPGMKNAFAGRRKSGASSTSIHRAEFVLRSELLRSSIDSSHLPTTSLSESESRPGTAGSTNSDTRSPFVRTFIPNRSKTTPLPPVNKQVDTSQKSSIAFANPWPVSRTSTVASATPPFAAEAVFSLNNPEQPPRIPFLRRFSLSKPATSAILDQSASYFPLVNGKSQRSKVRRTEPYGPPYHAPMPSKSGEGSDFALAVEKKLRRSRRFNSVQPGKPSSQKYSQDDLAQVLNEKLSAWQNTLALEAEAEPKYIWGPEEDASSEIVFRDPDMARTETAWDAWTMCYQKSYF